MHHDRIHAVGHGERLEMGLDGHWEGQFVNQVDWCAGDNGTATQVLEAKDWITRYKKKKEYFTDRYMSGCHIEYTVLTA